MPVAIMMDNPAVTVTIMVTVADVPMMVSSCTRIAADFLSLSWRHIAVAPACLPAVAPSRRTGIAPANVMPPVVIAITMTMNSIPPVVPILVFVSVMMLVTIAPFAVIVVFGCGRSTHRKGEHQKQRETQSAHLCTSENLPDEVAQWLAPSIMRSGGTSHNR